MPVEILTWLGNPVGELFTYVLLGLLAAILTITAWGVWNRARQLEYRTLARYAAALTIVAILMALLRGLVVGNHIPPEITRLVVPPVLSALDAARSAFLGLASVLFVAPGQQRPARRFFRLSLVAILPLYAFTAFSWAVDALAQPNLVYNERWQAIPGLVWQSLLSLAVAYLIARYGTTQKKLLLTSFSLAIAGVLIGIASIILNPLWMALAVGAAGLTTLLAFFLFTAAIYRLIISQLAYYVDEMASFVQDMQRRNRELFFLAEIGRAIIAGRDLTDMLTRVIEHVATALNAEWGAVFLLDEEEPARWHLCATYDAAHRRRTAELEDSGIWSRHPVLIGCSELPQTRHIQLAPAETAPGLPDDARAALIQPLRIRNQTVGAVIVGSREPRQFSEDDTRFCQTLANQLSVAIENARLHDETGQRAAEMTLLHEVSRALATSLDLEKTSRAILDSVGRIIDYAAAEICFYDEERRLLTTQGTVGPQGKQTYRVGEGLTGWLAQHRQPLLIADLQAEQTIQPKVRDIGDGLPIRAYVGLPLLIGERLIGTLELAHHRPGAFNSRTLRLLNEVAPQAAVALENAWLYSQTDEHLAQRVRELDTLSQLSREFSALLNLDELLDRTLTEAMRLTPATSGSLSLIQREQQLGTVQVWRGLTPVGLPDQWRLDDEHLVSQVARSGTARLMPDATAAPPFAHPATQSQLAVPIRYGAMVQGVIYMSSDQPAAFSRENLDFVQALADQAAIAIENARLYQQTDTALARRVQELNVIEEIDRQLSSTLDYRQVIELVLDNAIRATDAAAGLIALLEPPGTEMRILAERGYPAWAPAGGTWPTDRGVMGRVVRTGQPALVTDVTQDPDFVGVVEGSRSELAVPILREDRVLGVLNLESTTVGAFQEEHRSFVEHLAEHAGIAIENARLFAETQRRAEELAGLLEISTIASRTLDLQTLIKSVIDRTLALLGGEKATVMLFDETRQELVAQLIASVGATPEQVAAFHVSIHSENFQYSTFMTGRPYRTADAQNDPRILPAYRPFVAEFNIRSLLGVPLRVADRVIGEMYIASEREGIFTADHEHLLMAVASQLAASIENVRLYQLTGAALEKRVRELTAIQRIGQELNATLDLNQVLAVLIREALQATQASHGEVVLRDLETGQFSVVIWQGYTDEETVALRAQVPDAEDSLTGRVLRRKEPALVPDVQAEPVPASLKKETRAALAVPIFYAGDVVGTINLYSMVPNAFHQEDLGFVQALADQASVAIGNAQRYREQVQQAEQLRRRADQLTSVLQVGNVLRTDLTLDEILTEIAYAITEGTAFDAVLINVVEGDPPIVRRAAGAGIPLPMLQELMAVRQPLEKFRPIMRDDLRISQSYFVPRELRAEVFRDWHVVTLELPEEEERGENEWHTGDEFFVPMRGTDGAFLGYISLNAPRDRQRPTRRVAEDLEIFANQAAIAIENARLFDSLERRVETQRGLLEMATALQGVLDTRRIYELLADYLGQMFEFDNFTCYEIDWKTGLIHAPYARGRDAGQIMAETFPVGEGITGHVARTGRAEMVNHALEDPRVTLVAGTPREPESMLAIPLLAHDKVLGVMDVYRKGEQVFTEEEFAIAQLFANQAAAAVENARLFEETQRRLRELAALNEMALALSATLDLNALVEMIYRQTARVMDATNFYIALYDPARQMVSFPIAIEDQQRVETRPDFAPRRRGQGLTEYIIDTGLPVLIERDVPGWLADHGIAVIGPVAQSWLGVPFYVGEQVTGVICVQSYERQAAYDEGHLSLLSTIAAQAAVALENARLFEETQRRLNELAALNRVGQAISSALSLEQLLNVVYEQTSTLMDTTNFYIALYDAASDMISFPLSVDQYDTFRPPRRAGTGLTSYIIRTRQPVLIQEDTLAAHRRLGIEPVGTLAKSWLGVPMLAGEKVLGVIAVQSYDQEHLYDESHLEVLSTIAAQTAVAIENIRLYEETQARVEEMTHLYGISLATSSTTNLTEALTYIAEGALALTGAALSTVFVWDPDQERLVRQALATESTQLRALLTDLVPRPGGYSERVFTTRQPLIIPDTADTPDFNPLALAGGTRSAAAIPLLLRDRALGVLFVNHTEPHHFSDRELQVLSFLANQAAIAVESARLFEEIRQFSQELEQRVAERTAELATEKERVETLHRITSELSTTLELDPLLDRTLEHLVHITNAERGAILWLDPRLGLLVHRAAYGREEQLPAGGRPTPFRPGVGVAGWVLQHRQPLIIPDVRADERWLATDPASQTHAMMAVPVIVGDDVLGVATLSHPTVGFFREDQLRLVTTIIGEVGIAAHNAELYSYVREQAERMAQLYRSQEAEASKLGSILDSIADGVIVSDTHDRIILANRAAERILGTQAEVLTGQEIYRVMAIFGADDATFQELRHELVTGRQSIARVFEWEPERKVINAHIAPVFTERSEFLGGEFVGLVTVFRDITKEYEVDRMKTEFVSTVSHELRTPLTSIKGYVDLILDGDAGEINDEVREFLRIVQNNSDRLTDLINDLLDISRIETGRVRLALEPVSLGELVEEVLDSHRTRIAERPLTIHMDLPPDLPPVYADAQRLYQILNNLVTNAYKYTPPGGSITITAQIKDHKVQVDVADTGIGISEEDQKRLFSRFFRADHPLVRQAPGTGLGLAISRSLVNLHGGEMWMTSELGKGSVFSFTIPLVEAENRLAATAPVR